MTERLYEGLFLVNAADATQDWTELESSIRGIIDQNGAVIEHAEKWPEQRLAYDVNGVKRGVYYLTYFRSDSQAVAPIRSDAQLFEKILRFLVIQDPFLEDELVKRKDAAARRMAEPPRASATEATPASKPSETDSPAETAVAETVEEESSPVEDVQEVVAEDAATDQQVEEESNDQAAETESDDNEAEQN